MKSEGFIGAAAPPSILESLMRTKLERWNRHDQSGNHLSGVRMPSPTDQYPEVYRSLRRRKSARRGSAAVSGAASRISSTFSNL